MFKAHKEIFGQGKSLEKTWKYIIESESNIQDFFAGNNFNDIVFIACGSSYWASMSASMSFSETFHKSCYAVKSGDIILNQDYYQNLYNKPLIIAPSRSGSTSETWMALDFFRNHYNSPVLSIVGMNHSPVADRSDLTLEIPWIREESICQTQAFSNLYLACILISALLRSDQELMSELEEYITDFPRISSMTEGSIKSLIKNFPGYSSLFVLGNGKQYGVAVEAAYISVEMAICSAGYFGTLEFRHGPIVMCDPQVLVAVIHNGHDTPYENSLLHEISDTGAKVLLISGKNCRVEATFRFICQFTVPEVIALFGVFVMQGLAFYKAIHKGLNPDQPGNLKRWINLEQDEDKV